MAYVPYEAPGYTRVRQMVLFRRMRSLSHAALSKFVLLLLQEKWRENKIEAPGEMLSPHCHRAATDEPPSAMATDACAQAREQLARISIVSAQ